MKSNEQFIEDAKKVHGDKYDYSKVDYKGSFEKIKIICKEHGMFEQTPHTHLRGGGCPKCGIISSTEKKVSNTSEFIEKAKQVHGNKYDYSKVEYVNAHKKVCIICQEHGEFWQRPSNHLNGDGCPVCRYSKISNKTKKSNEKFIKESKLIHGDKYDYSKVEYINNHTKVCIICPEHGEFWQLPNNHLKGCGCPSCGGNKKYTLDTFIEKAKKVHGNKYDYSKVNYINCNTKVCIICPEHGEFWQSPACHVIRHYGCPICDESHLERDVRELLNENNINFIQEYNEKWLGKQFADFYLPKENIIIECQGEGHFAPVRFNGIGWDKARKNYLNVVRLDNEKREKCKKNGTKLLYYSNLKIKYPYKVITDKDNLLKIIQNE